MRRPVGWNIVIRRLLPAVLALSAALTLGSCASVTGDDAVVVNGVSLPRTELEQLTTELFDVDTDFVQARFPQQVATNWIIDQLILQFLDEQGITIDDAARAEAENRVDSELGAQQLDVSGLTRDYLVTSAAARTVFSATQPDGGLLEYAEAADIHVDSRYGHWVLDAGAVLSLG